MAKQQFKHKDCILIDVMKNNGDIFVTTLKYYHPTIFKVNMKEIEQFVFSKLPTLKSRNDIKLILY